MLIDGRRTVLCVEGLGKRIGKRWIVNNVNFKVHEGEIFGFLGPNGAGKTTTIRMLVDLIRPTKGTVNICGYEVRKDPEQALAKVGSIVENPEVYNFLTGWDNLEQHARVLPNVDHARMYEVARMVQLEHRIHDKVKTYSLGMRQRLGIALALLGEPELLILDEPTNGLDPKGIHELRAFIRKLADDGMAVFVSSHLLSEIQLLCDRVAIINNGQVQAVGGVQQLLDSRSNYAVWELEPRGAAEQVLASMGATIIASLDHELDSSAQVSITAKEIVTVIGRKPVADIVKQLVSEGITIHSVRTVTPTLEQLFLEMTDGDAT